MLVAVPRIDADDTTAKWRYIVSAEILDTPVAMYLPTPTPYLLPGMDNIEAEIAAFELEIAEHDAHMRDEAERKQLQVQWIFGQFGHCFTFEDPNLAYNYFISAICNNFIVKSKSNYCKAIDIKPWITLGIKTSIKIRNKLFRKKQLQLVKLYKAKIKHYINILR